MKIKTTMLFEEMRKPDPIFFVNTDPNYSSEYNCKM
jgi:hypothetical protein